MRYQFQECVSWDTHLKNAHQNGILGHLPENGILVKKKLKGGIFVPENNTRGLAFSKSFETIFTYFSKLAATSIPNSFYIPIAIRKGIPFATNHLILNFVS